jgi:hypothetical protein
MLAGHSNIATTMRYVHPEQADVFGIVAAMSTKPVKLSWQPVSKDRKAPTKAVRTD